MEGGISVKCDNCTHGNVCVHKAAYASLIKKAEDAMPGEEMHAMGADYPFTIEVRCKHYMEQKRTIDYIHLQQVPRPF